MIHTARESRPLVVLDRVTITRGDGPAILENVSWSVREGEVWAVTGPIGSGKTTLAEVLIGRHLIRSGTITWPLLEQLRASGQSVPGPATVIRHVAFQEDSRLFTYRGHYYQQRFEFADTEEPLSLFDYLRSGTNATDAEIQLVASRLGVEHRLTVSFIKLSNGQTRRARIARALLTHPELLILDDPYLGLDVGGRADLTRFLESLIREGQKLILIAPPRHLPSWITHVRELRSPSGDHAPQTPVPQRQPVVDSKEPAQPIIELRNVTVQHGGKTILDNINWTVRSGERWAVLGPNGSGKTTLLSLLCGDHPQAYANEIRLFGKQRGSGESIWEVKRRVGLVSPEFHLYFTQPLTADRVVATGFFDALTDQPTTPTQDAAIVELFQAFAISDLARRPFRQLSTGEQRLILIVRALVKRPPLLILDEPFQGLDASTASRIRDWLDQHLGADQTLLFVSHHEEEIPRSVTRRFSLMNGQRQTSD